MKSAARSWFVILAVLLPLLFTVSGCQPRDAAGPEQTAREVEQQGHADEMPSLSPVMLAEGERLQVVATTSIVADVVQNVGGDQIELTTLMPRGTDPHAFEPTPRDAAAVADAHVVFVSGAGLEEFLERLLQGAGEGMPIVPVSYGIELLQFEGSGEQGSQEHDGESEGDQGHTGGDPHTWFDPNNVMVWTHNVEHALSALDPAHAEAYTANAAAYEQELKGLHTWIGEQIALVPAADRKLVTDHTGFTYFAHQYGFELIGAIFPGYSTLTEPSARELAELEEAIQAYAVKAIFVGLTVSPDLAQRVADDTGIELVFLYTGSLSEPDGPANDYLSFMRYNVTQIVQALR